MELPAAPSQPLRFEAMPELGAVLRQRQLVLLHVAAMTPAEAQRAIDWLGGCTLAIAGEQRRLGPQLFCFAPPSWQQSPDQRHLLEQLLAAPAPEALWLPPPAAAPLPAPQRRPQGSAPLDLAWRLTGFALLLWAPLLGWDLGMQLFQQAALPVTPEPQLPAPAHPAAPLRVPLGRAAGPLPEAASGSLVPVSELQAPPTAAAASPLAAFSQESQASLLLSAGREPSLFEQLQGADGLGGPITLASLEEPPMPAAALAERLIWQRSGDPLAPLPLHWRDALRPELAAEQLVQTAEVVRLPAPHLSAPETIPLLLRPDGLADGLVQPSSPASQQLVEAWARRQRYSPSDGVRPVLLRLEPLAALPPEPETP